MKIRKMMLFLFLGIITVSFTVPAYGEIKIGSIAPELSPWDKTLRKLNREWIKITQGKVRIKIFSGEIFGNEKDMIKGMEEGRLNGTALSNIGLCHLYKDAFVLNIPFLFRSDDEFEYIFKKMRPGFEKGIEAKGYKVILWSFNGWLNYFSKKPIFYPEDLKAHTMGMIAENPELEKAWQDAGYNVVWTDFKDLGTALQSGMVDAFYLPPIIAALGQYFNHASNMSSLKIVPLIGVFVLSEKTWETIPEKHKAPLLKIAGEIGDELYPEVIKLEKDSIKEMEEEDLIVNRLPADALKKWQEVSRQTTKPLIGKSFSKKTYDLLKKYLKEYRESREVKQSK